MPSGAGCWRGSGPASAGVGVSCGALGSAGAWTAGSAAGPSAGSSWLFEGRSARCAAVLAGGWSRACSRGRGLGRVAPQAACAAAQPTAAQAWPHLDLRLTGAPLSGVGGARKPAGQLLPASWRRPVECCRGWGWTRGLRRQAASWRSAGPWRRKARGAAEAGSFRADAARARLGDARGCLRRGIGLVLCARTQRCWRPALLPAGLRPPARLCMPGLDECWARHLGALVSPVQRYEWGATDVSAAGVRGEDKVQRAQAEVTGTGSQGLGDAGGAAAPAAWLRCPAVAPVSDRQCACLLSGSLGPDLAALGEVPEGCAAAFMRLAAGVQRSLLDLHAANSAPVGKLWRACPAAGHSGCSQPA